MNNMRKNDLIFIISLIIILAIAYVLLPLRVVNDDTWSDREYKNLSERYDSLYKAAELLGLEVDSLISIIDTGKVKIEYVQKIKYEKINSIDNIDSDSVLSILTERLSAKSGNRK